MECFLHLSSSNLTLGLHSETISIIGLRKRWGIPHDILTAYREGKFAPSRKPWLGWLMLLEETPKSTSPVRVDEPHFDVFPVFRNASYKERYRIFCERLVRERLYDAACLLLSDLETGREGQYRELGQETDFCDFFGFSDSSCNHVLEKTCSMRRGFAAGGRSGEFRGAGVCRTPGKRSLKAHGFRGCLMGIMVSEA